MATKTYIVGQYKTFEKIRVTVYTECHKCGQMFTGTVYTYNPNWETVSKLARDSVKVCHICNAKFMQKDEYSLISSSSSSVAKKELSEKIARFEAEICREDISKQLAKRVKTVDDMPVNNAVAQKVKAGVLSLKAYIQQTIDLEIWARFIEEHIISIEAEKKLFQKAGIHSSSVNLKSAEKAVKEKEKALLAEIDTLKKEFAAKDWKVEPQYVKIKVPVKPMYLAERVPVKPTPPVMKQAGLFNKKKVLVENELLQKKYEKACSEYEQQLRKLQQAKDKNNAMRKQYEENLKKYKDEVEAQEARIAEENKKLKAESSARKKAAKEVLDTKIEEIRQKIEKLKNPSVDVSVSYIETVLKKDKDNWQKLLKNVCDARNKLFSANVIYPNYRDVFALSSIFEYLNSERCYELEGPDGAYNLYERERRSDAFATFFRKLEDISKNQVILYKETSKMFENLKKLDDCMKEATKAIADKKSDITDEFVDEILKKYFADSEAVKSNIVKSAKDAAEYTK